MRTIVTIAAVAALAGAPIAAAAQPPGDYWQGDVCHQQKHAAASRGTFLGAIFGGIFGSALAGRNRAAGAVIGGTAGAAIGHAVGKDSVQCLPYPPRISAHDPNCHWASENYDDGEHQFEVCRDPDGVWRPSGRS
jgi:hypothetical protein